MSVRFLVGLKFSESFVPTILLVAVHAVTATLFLLLLLLTIITSIWTAFDAFLVLFPFLLFLLFVVFAAAFPFAFAAVVAAIYWWRSAVVCFRRHV